MLWNTNEIAVLTGRGMDCRYLKSTDVGARDDTLPGNVTARFAPREIGF